MPWQVRSNEMKKLIIIFMILFSVQAIAQNEDPISRDSAKTTETILRMLGEWTLKALRTKEINTLYRKTANKAYTTAKDSFEVSFTPTFLSIHADCSITDTLWISEYVDFPDSASVILKDNNETYNSLADDQKVYLKSNNASGVGVSISCEGR